MPKINDVSDIRSSLEEAYGETDDTELEPGAAASASDDAGALDDGAAGSEDDAPSGRDRDEKGRFKAKAPASEPGAEEATPPAEKPQPAGFSKEDEAFLAALGDNRARVEAMLKEAGADSALKIEQLGKREQELEALAQFQGIEEALAPILPIVQAHGASALEGIATMARVHAWADQQPAEFANWWIETGKIDITQLPAVKAQLEAAGLQITKKDAADEWDDWDTPTETPEVKALKEQINGLQNTVQQLQGGFTQAQQAQQHEAHQAHLMQIGQAIQAFAEEKNPDGSIKNYLFNDAAPYMEQRAKQYTAVGQQVPPLDKLYEETVHAVPVLRQKLQAAESKKAAQAQDAERIAKARQAKRAGSPVSGAPTNHQVSGDTDIRSLVTAAWNDSVLAQGDRI